MIVQVLRERRQSIWQEIPDWLHDQLRAQNAGLRILSAAESIFVCEVFDADMKPERRNLVAMTLFPCFVCLGEWRKTDEGWAITAYLD